MEDKKKQLLSVLKARMEEARNKPMTMNPRLMQIIQRAKAQGTQPMQKVSREEMIERFRNRIKQK